MTYHYANGAMRRRPARVIRLDDHRDPPLERQAITPAELQQVGRAPVVRPATTGHYAYGTPRWYHDQSTRQRVDRVCRWIAAACAVVIALVYLLGCGPADPTFERDIPHEWDRSRFPLRVTSTDDLDVDDIQAAVGLWNAGPCELLVHDGIGEHGDLVVTIGDDIRADAAGGWQLRRRDGRWYGVALIRQPYDRRVITLAAAHEIGHLLGLAHDRSAASIMHPEAAGRDGYIAATHADLVALASRYCR